jgi:hypothetical protein
MIIQQLYDFRKPKYNAFSVLPTIGFNPDDGIKIELLQTMR